MEANEAAASGPAAPRGPWRGKRGVCFQVVNHVSWSLLEHLLLASTKCPSSLNFNDVIDIFTKSKACKGVF